MILFLSFLFNGKDLQADDQIPGLLDIREEIFSRITGTAFYLNPLKTGLPDQFQIGFLPDGSGQTSKVDLKRLPKFLRESLVQD